MTLTDAAHLAAAHWSLVSDFLLAAFGVLLAGSVYLMAQVLEETR